VVSFGSFWLSRLRFRFLKRKGRILEEGFDSDLHEVSEAFANALGMINNLERLVYKDTHGTSLS